VLVYAIYNAIHGYLETRFNLFLFSLMIFTFLSGYVVRFLSVKSFVKYVIFACGLAAGWMIL
jgi:PTS system mannose-specific IIC component